jgi:glycosyltransferase involved in cell wall biosynthesis
MASQPHPAITPLPRHTSLHSVRRRPPVVGLVATDPEAPSFRLRLHPLARHLKHLGVEARSYTLRGPEWWRVLRLTRAWQSCDLLLFSKLKLLLGEREFVARRCHTWVFDVDDAVMFRKPARHGEPPDTAWWRRHRFERMVRSCRLVVAASHSLASMVGSEAAHVEVLPTPVELATYPKARLSGQGTVKLVWIGLPANLRYLTDLAPLLRDLARDGLDFELHIICDRLPEMPGVPCRLVPWSDLTAGRDLAACDVGMAPLSDDAWTRGKGAYRSIQYAAAGLPAVASPVGANREVVRPGETGVWASTPQEWRTALERLVCNPVLRRRLGAAARQHARAYDRSVLLHRYAAHLVRLLGERRASPE